MSLFITLVGGPLDGIFIPANPEMPGVPTELYINDEEAPSWSHYANSKAGGEPPALDVYSLRKGAVRRLTSPPPDAELCRLNYVRALSPQEVAQIKSIGRKHGL